MKAQTDGRDSKCGTASRERFLAELADRAARSLPRDTAEALVAEARDHLDAAIAARIELESPPEVAEREAVAAFGTAKSIVRQEEYLRRGRFQSLFLALTTFGGVGWAFTMLASPTLGRFPVVIVGVAFFTELGCLTACSH